MKLGPGYTVTTTPQLPPADRPGRIQVCSGVEESDGRFFPKADWRPPSAEELALLAPGAAGGADDSLHLFGLPGHLQSAWWRLLGAAREPGGGLGGFDAFAARVGEYLTFKQLGAPDGAVYELVAARPGEKSARWDTAANTYTGLAFGAADRGRPWGGINLGVQPTSVVLVNLTPGQLAAALRRLDPDRPPPSPPAELAKAFFQACADYPILRVWLDPGEGYRLPAGDVLFDGCTLDQEEPGLVLVVRGP